MERHKENLLAALGEAVRRSDAERIIELVGKLWRDCGVSNFDCYVFVRDTVGTSVPEWFDLWEAGR